MMHSFDWSKTHIKDTGRVVKTSASYVWVEGLKDARIGEVVSFATGTHGIVTKLDRPMQMMSFAQSTLKVGTEAARTSESLHVSVGDGLWGKTVDALGYLEGEEKRKSHETKNCPVEVTAGDISTRAEIDEFFPTGVAIVDLMTPLGKGQRELVIGDQKTGKTAFVLHAMITQAKAGTKCVLALIGKQRAEIARIEKMLATAGVRKNVIIVAEPARSAASRIFIVPYAAMTIAEHFRDLGQDVLVVLDDLSYHALRYREMALLGDAYPGRDAYPGDIFSIHSRLLERAGSFSVHGKKATITCLAVVETVEGDLTGYIQTNLMSMTDGHLFFDKNLFYEGIRPAVNVFISVTRVGKQTQPKHLKEVGQKILGVMSRYTDLKRFLRFGPELTHDAQETIRLAQGMKNFFTQRDVSFSLNEETALADLLFSGSWDGKDASAKLKNQKSK